MRRFDFRQLFGTLGPVVLPVVHVLDADRTVGNLRVATGAGARGCFLINHDFGPEEFLPIIRHARDRFPDLWMGVNFLAVTGREAFPKLAALADEGCRIDAYWADDARIGEGGDSGEAREIARVREASGWEGLYFGGTAFKAQSRVDPSRYGDAAREAAGFMDVVTTSGAATGQAADPGKVAAFREAIGDTALALASGIESGNAASFAEADCFMVATGINEPGNFHDICGKRLEELLQVAAGLGRRDRQ